MGWGRGSIEVGDRPRQVLVRDRAATRALVVVYIPPEVTGAVAGGGAVRLVTSSETDGSRLVFAVPTGGEFQVTVAAAPKRLTPCS